MMRAAGFDLETAWFGPAAGDAPTLVLLHEGLGCLKLWKDFPERLTARTGLGVLAYSRAGYGASDPVPLPRPLSYMHDEARSALPEILDAAGISRAVLVGHSDGASIAAIYAGSTQDHRVAGLVLMAPHFFVEGMGIASIEAAKVAYETTDLRGKLARYHADVDVAFHGWNDAWLDPGFRAWNLQSELAHIRVPMLIIQGEEDQYGTAAQLEMAERECYSPVETLLLPHCRHAPQLDQPDATLEAIAGFVDRVLER